MGNDYLLSWFNITFLGWGLQKSLHKEEDPHTPVKKEDLETFQRFCILYLFVFFRTGFLIEKLIIKIVWEQENKEIGCFLMSKDV